jgi:hypothetical protein
VTLEDETRDEGGGEKSFKALVVLSYSIICMEISLIFVVFIRLHVWKLIQLLDETEGRERHLYSLRW